MDSETIEKYRQSGKIAAKALQHASKLIKPGVKLVTVCDAAEDKIRELGGGIAFPTQTSRNEIAAHYCPEDDDETVYQEGDVVKLDVGATVDGYVSDNALTVDLGDHAKLVKASREAVNAALKIVKPGTTLGEIGTAIQTAIEKYGFAPVKNLSGHGIGHYSVHESPSVPNFDSGSKNELVEGQSIAIEPFASTGAGMIQESSNPTVFMHVARRSVRSAFGRDILKDIESYNGLPFTTRWLSRKHGIGKTKFGLRELVNAGVIRGYPPLPDVRKGLVSQAEHSVLVFDKPIIITKLDE
ncbi:type II methionyl aminopeptidase [Candidatus Woesearchaeota archaeon]|nr:type II methionyl aminopeptidase [Candidatus Woesearchaeota archaeon]